MKKIFIIVLALLVLGVIGMLLPEDKETAKNENTTDGLAATDIELLKMNGHPILNEQYKA